MELLIGSFPEEVQYITHQRVNSIPPKTPNINIGEGSSTFTTKFSPGARLLIQRMSARRCEIAVVILVAITIITNQINPKR